jgi:hypothetical protein
VSSVLEKEKHSVLEKEKHSVLVEGEKVGHSVLEKEKHSVLVEGDIEEIIAPAIPRERSRNHHHLFTLARSIKTFEIEYDEKLNRGDLRRIFDAWYKASLKYLRPGQSKDEYRFEFLDALDNAKYPLGKWLIKKAIVKDAKKKPLPEIAKNYPCKKIQFLIAVCREFQRSAGDNPFFLSCRMAGDILGISFTRANRMLQGLEREKILHVVKRGGPDTNKATRFRYIPPLKDTPEERNQTTMQDKDKIPQNELSAEDKKLLDVPADRSLRKREQTRTGGKLKRKKLPPGA